MSSKFIDSCANYSEINVIRKLLKPLLNDFNNHLVNINKKQFNLKNDYNFLIPNNGIKYYMFLTSKPKSKFKTCYFFPDKFTNEHDEFFIEINDFGFEKDSYLFEGYLYNTDTFLISDLLFIDSKLLEIDYITRHTIINSIFTRQHNNINGFFNIGIHHYLRNENLLPIFLENFIFKNTLKQIEHLNNINFEKTIENIDNNKQTCKKIIEKTKLVEVYNVYNIESKNNEGLLYIKSIKDSKKIKELFKNTDSTTLECNWNSNFNKWTVTF